MKLLWLDLETTGLDPRKDVILEISVAQASLENPFDAERIYHAVLHLFSANVELSPFILDMHTKNGLLAECADHGSTIEEVEEDLLKCVPEETNKDDKPTLAGNSVHFDLGFIRHHMPRLAKRLSHRVYDVSAVKLFCRSLGMPDFKLPEAHRATDDVNSSIVQAKMCHYWLIERGSDDE